MDTDFALQSATELIKPWAIETRMPETNRVDAVISGANLYECVAAIVKAKWGYLSAIIGLDTLNLSAIQAAAAGGTEPEPMPFEVLYAFSHGAAVLTLRVTVPRQNPVIPSVCGLISSASLYERELMEMFGIDIIGTPDKGRLLISDDWPANVYPLRKDFTGLKTGTDDSPAS